MRGSIQKQHPERPPSTRKKHRDGGVGSVVANHCGGGESSVVVTTLETNDIIQGLPKKRNPRNPLKCDIG